MAKLLTPLKPTTPPQKDDFFTKDIMDVMTTSMMIVITIVFFLPRVIGSLGMSTAQV